MECFRKPGDNIFGKEQKINQITTKQIKYSFGGTLHDIFFLTRI